VVDGVLSQMKLAALPPGARKNGLAGGTQPGVIVAGDEVHPAQTASDQIIEKAAPVDLGFRQRGGDAEHAPAAFGIDADRRQDGGIVLAYHVYRGNERLDAVTDYLAEQTSAIRVAPDVPTLMGIEGQGRKRYYDAWRNIDPRLDFGPRVKRPPNNPINCLISYLNGLTYAIVRHEIAKTHVDETLAFLHAPSSSRASLSLDIAELFKPALVDKLIHRLIRKGEIEDAWFEQNGGVCLLSSVGRRVIAGKFATRLEEGGDGKSIRSTILSEALAIQRHVLGISPYKAHRDRI
jgi:CRISPR-associated protein Cas1